jgi:DNA-binding protein H-NS
MTMTNTLEDFISSSSIEQLRALIDKAESSIEDKKIDEIYAIRERYFEMAALVDMTPEGILSYSSRKRRSSGKPKYRNPHDYNQTWTGHGKKPGWMRQELDNGASMEDFRIPE